MAEASRARRQSSEADKAATGGQRTRQQSGKQDKEDTKTMAELTIRPDEIRDALAKFVQEYEPEGASRQEVGVVADAGDGIAHVEGLPSAMANELLEFPGGIRGLALNLDVREIGVVILGDFSKVEEGQQVRRTGEVLSVPVGDGFLGRAHYAPAHERGASTHGAACARAQCRRPHVARRSVRRRRWRAAAIPVPSMTRSCAGFDRSRSNSAN